MCISGTSYFFFTDMDPLQFRIDPQGDHFNLLMNLLMISFILKNTVFNWNFFKKSFVNHLVICSTTLSINQYTKFPKLYAGSQETPKIKLMCQKTVEITRLVVIVIMAQWKNYSYSQDKPLQFLMFSSLCQPPWSEKRSSW